MQDLPSYHDGLLYVTVDIKNVELQHAMVDTGSSLKLIP